MPDKSKFDAADFRDEKAVLDWLPDNLQHADAPELMRRLNVTPVEVQAYGETRKLSPDDPDVTKVRNLIFDKVMDVKDGVGLKDRFVLKGLIYDEPELQKRWLERKGLETEVQGKDVVWRRPGEKDFRPIDPKGIDLFDFVDIVPEAVDMAIGTAATSSKVVGALGGGPAGLALASGLSGAASAASEAGKQGLAIQLGAQDELMPGKIAEAGIIGAAVPPIFAGAGKALKGAGNVASKAIGWIQGSNIKPEAEAIKNAARELGADVTPGMLSKSGYVTEIEKRLIKKPSILTAGLRGRVRTNEEVFEKTLDDILVRGAEMVQGDAGKGGKTLAQDILKERAGEPIEQGGAALGESLRKSVAEKLKPAEEIYQKYEGRMRMIRPNLQEVSGTIDALKKEMPLDRGARGLLDRIQEDLGNIRNLDQLKDARSNLYDMINPEAATKNERKIIQALYDGFTRARSDTLKRGAEKSEFYQEALNDIAKADSTYRVAIRDVEESILSGGKRVKGGPKGAVESFLAKNPEIKRIDKLFDTADPARLERLQKAFPREFEIARRNKIEKIADVASRSKDMPAALLAQLERVPATSRKLMIGPNADEQLGKLKTYIRSSPENIRDFANPSKVEAFKAQFPDEFEMLRAAKVQEIADKIDRLSPGQKLRNAINIIDRVPNQAKNVLFNPDELKKFENLKTVVRAKPYGEFGASIAANSSAGDLMNLIFDIPTLFEIAGTKALTSDIVGQSLRGTGAAVGSSIGKGAGMTAVKGVMLPDQERQPPRLYIPSK